MAWPSQFFIAAITRFCLPFKTSHVCLSFIDAQSASFFIIYDSVYIRPGSAFRVAERNLRHWRFAGSFFKRLSRNLFSLPGVRSICGQGLLLCSKLCDGYVRHLLCDVVHRLLRQSATCGTACGETSTTHFLNRAVVGIWVAIKKVRDPVVVTVSVPSI